MEPLFEVEAEGVPSPKEKEKTHLSFSRKSKSQIPDLFRSGNQESLGRPQIQKGEHSASARVSDLKSESFTTGFQTKTKTNQINANESFNGTMRSDNFLSLRASAHEEGFWAPGSQQLETFRVEDFMSSHFSTKPNKRKGKSAEIEGISQFTRPIIPVYMNRIRLLEKHGSDQEKKEGGWETHQKSEDFGEINGVHGQKRLRERLERKNTEDKRGTWQPFWTISERNQARIELQAMKSYYFQFECKSMGSPLQLSIVLEKKKQVGAGVSFSVFVSFSCPRPTEKKCDFSFCKKSLIIIHEPSNGRFFKSSFVYFSVSSKEDSSIVVSGQFTKHQDVVKPVDFEREAREGPMSVLDKTILRICSNIDDQELRERIIKIKSKKSKERQRAMATQNFKGIIPLKGIFGNPKDFFRHSGVLESCSGLPLANRNEETESLVQMRGASPRDRRIESVFDRASTLPDNFSKKNQSKLSKNQTGKKGSIDIPQNGVSGCGELCLNQCETEKEEGAFENAEYHPSSQEIMRAFAKFQLKRQKKSQEREALAKERKKQLVFQKKQHFEYKQEESLVNNGLRAQLFRTLELAKQTKSRQVSWVILLKTIRSFVLAKKSLWRKKEEIEEKKRMVVALNQLLAGYRIQAKKKAPKYHFRNIIDCKEY